MTIAKPNHGDTGWDTNLNLVIDAVNAATLTPTAVKTANYTAAANDLVLADLSGGAFTIELPTTPAEISEDSASSCAVASLSVLRPTGARNSRS